MKILLFEPNYDRQIVPLGLMKISSYHKSLGDEVKYTRQTENADGFIPDTIYVTTLFTWDYDFVVKNIKRLKQQYPKAEIKIGGILASLMPNDIEKDTGIKPHIGVLEEVENIMPDYSLFPEIDYTIGFTTRGCIRKCGWCPVWRIEEYKEYKDWYKNLDLSKKRIVLMDNNFTASTDEHFYNTIKKLQAINKEVDFNQSVDCRLIDEKKAIAFASIKIRPFRISFDSMESDGHAQKCINLLHDVGFINICVDVLYNFNDTPEDFYYRLKELAKLKVDAFPMRFQPLSGTFAREKSSFVGKNYTKEMLENFRVFFNSVYINGCIGRGTTIEKFEETFGKTPEEFVAKLKQPKKKLDEECKTIALNHFKGKHQKYRTQQELVI